MTFSTLDSSGKKLSQKSICTNFSDYLIERVRIITYRDTNETFWYRDAGYYEPAEPMIREMATRELGEDATRNMVGEIIARIKNLTMVDRIEPPPNLIPIENGLYNLDKQDLEKHSPDFQFFGLHPIRYNPEAKCPKIEKFLDEVMNENKERKENLLKLIGYTFYRETPFHHIFVLHGKGRNGKSVLMNLMINMLGKHYVSNVRLHELTENRFAKVELYRKNANISGELNVDKVKDTADLKDISGGDPVKMERKFQAPFYATIYAKNIFAGNVLPEVADKTDAWTSRLLQIDFERQFIDENQNPDLLKELSTPDELSGLFNLAMDYLESLLEEKGFDTKSIEERRREYAKSSSSTLGFISDELEFLSGVETPKDKMWQQYLVYCTTNNKRTANEQSFWRTFKAMCGGQVEESRPRMRNSDKRTRVWRGVRIKTIGPGSPPYSTSIEDNGNSSDRVVSNIVDQVDRFSSNEITPRELI